MIQEIVGAIAEAIVVMAILIVTLVGLCICVYKDVKK